MNALVKLANTIVLVKLADREMAVETSMEVSNRVERLKKAVQAETNGACIERPMLWTKYHRNKAFCRQL